MRVHDRSAESAAYDSPGQSSAKPWVHLSRIISPTGAALTSWQNLDPRRIKFECSKHVTIGQLCVPRFRVWWEFHVIQTAVYLSGRLVIYLCRAVNPWRFMTWLAD